MNDGTPPPQRQPWLNLPPMTKALLLANVAVHLLRLLLPEALDDSLLVTFGFVPARYVASLRPSWVALVDPLTYQFLHGSLAHLGVNMLALVAFGSGVEQRLGPLRYLVFYLVCGIAAAFTQFAVGPAATDLLVGASGAISGLFGAILRFRLPRRALWLLVAIWLVVNVVTGESDMAGMPVAWIAHVGGFAAGLLLFPLFAGRPRGRA
jgi:membrane associated rhomboid family serine protease